MEGGIVGESKRAEDVFFVPMMSVWARPRNAMEKVHHMFNGNDFDSNSCFFEQ